MLIFAYILLMLMQVVAPLCLLLWLGARTSASKLDWLIRFSIVGCFVLWQFMAGRWDILSYYARHLLLALFVCASLVSLAAARSAPLFAARGAPWWFSFGARSILLVLLAAIVWSASSARGYTEPALSLDLPLKDGVYYVAHGGSRAILNHHVAVAQQRYALDIDALNILGRRSSRLLPREPEKYVIYGHGVYSPCDCEVVEAVDDLPDQSPPLADPTLPAGNHLWLKHEGNVFILLAHLMRGSIKVAAGERVSSGQPLARVGNSGNTTEPHLHLHAVRFEEAPEETGSQFLLRNGAAVPLLFEGRFLTRNSLFNLFHGRR